MKLFWMSESTVCLMADMAAELSGWRVDRTEPVLGRGAREGGLLSGGGGVSEKSGRGVGEMAWL